MGTYVDFLLLALCLFASCMVPSKQMDDIEHDDPAPPAQAQPNAPEPAHQGNNEDDVQIRELRPPRAVQENGEVWTRAHDIELARMLRGIPQNSRIRKRRLHEQWLLAHPRMSHLSENYLYNRANDLLGGQERRRRIDIPWNENYQSVLLQLYLHDTEVNKNPYLLHQRWIEIYPDLPDIGRERLFRKAVRLQSDLRGHREINRNQEPDVISVDTSAPSEHFSESGSEYSYGDSRESSPRILKKSRYTEKGDSEASSSWYPRYPRSPKSSR